MMPTPYYQHDVVDFRVDRLVLLGLAVVTVAVMLLVRRYRSNRQDGN